MRRSVPAPPAANQALQLSLLLFAGTGIGYLVANQYRLAALTSIRFNGFRYWVFTIGTLTLILLLVVPTTRRMLTSRLGDDISLPLFLSIAAIQLSGIKVGLATLSALTSMVLILYWFVHRAMSPDRRMTLTPFSAIVIGFVASTFWSSTGYGYLSLSTVPQLYFKIITAIIVVDLLDTRERIKKALLICFVFLGINAVFGVIQQVLSQGFGLNISMASKEMRFRKGFLATSGLGMSRNIFGQTSSIYTCMAILISASRFGRAHRRWLVPVILVTLTQIYMSFSRGAWAGLLVGLLAMPFIIRPAATPYILSTYSVGGVAVWFSGIGQRAVQAALGLSQVSNDDRYFLMQSGAQVMATNLWKGVGLDAFDRFDVAPGSVGVHNALFAAGTELGLPGMILYAAMMVWVFVHIMVAISKTSDPEFKTYLRAILAGLCSLYLALQVNALDYSYFVFMTLALAEAAATTAIREEETRRTAARQQLARQQPWKEPR